MLYLEQQKKAQLINSCELLYFIPSHVHLVEGLTKAGQKTTVLKYHISNP